MGLGYRLRQFWQDVWLHRRPLPDRLWHEVAAVLTPAEQALFKLQPFPDQWHSYAVWSALHQAGYDQRPLMAAALLHDVGKSEQPINQWDRILPVVVNRLSPGLCRRLGQSNPSGWRRPFVVKQQHASWGAGMAARAGSHPTTVRLIGHHQDSGVAADDVLLTALQQADDQA